MIQQAIHGHRGRKDDPLYADPQHPPPITSRSRSPGAVPNGDAFLGYFTTGGANNGGPY